MTRHGSGHGAGTLISYLDVVPMLRGACPSFEGSPEAVASEPESGEFLLAAHFAAHLFALAREHRTESFPAVFAVVERVLAEGDLEAHHLVEDGLLDDLTNPRLFDHQRTSVGVFEPWLGPLTRRVPAVAEALETPDDGAGPGRDDSFS